MRQSHSKSSSLPARFPVGARYVVEGRGGEDGQLRVFSRYIVLPGGRRIKLSADFNATPGLSEPVSKRGATRSSSGRGLSRAKKISGRAGTNRQQRH
jgi:hypothetical protein